MRIHEKIALNKILNQMKIRKEKKKNKNLLSEEWGLIENESFLSDFNISNKMEKLNNLCVDKFDKFSHKKNDSNQEKLKKNPFQNFYLQEKVLFIDSDNEEKSDEFDIYDIDEKKNEENLHIYKENNYDNNNLKELGVKNICRDENFIVIRNKIENDFKNFEILIQNLIDKIELNVEENNLIYIYSIFNLQCQIYRFLIKFGNNKELGNIIDWKIIQKKLYNFLKKKKNKIIFFSTNYLILYFLSANNFNSISDLNASEEKFEDKIFNFELFNLELKKFVNKKK